jgi:hypothetical protein
MASKTTSKTPVTKTTVSTKASKAELVEEVHEEVEQTVEQTKTKTKAVKEPVPETAQQDVAENKAEFETYEEVANARSEILAAIKKYNARLTFLDKEANRLHSKVAKEAKKKNKRVNTDPNKKPAGFDVPVLIPEKFYKFLTTGLKKNKFSEEKTTELTEKNIQSDSLIARSFVTKMVYDYIKHCNLYEENADQNKRFIKPDEAIKSLFSMQVVPVARNKKGEIVKVGETLQKNQTESKDDKVSDELEPIGFFNFQTYVCRLFPKKAKTQDEDEDDGEEVEEEAGEDEVEEEVAEEEPAPEPVKKKSTKSKTASAV